MPAMRTTSRGESAGPLAGFVWRDRTLRRVVAKRRAKPRRNRVHLSGMPAACVRRVAVLLAIGGAIGAGVPAAGAAAPPDLTAIKLEQKLGASIPLDATFTAEDGRTVSLGDYIAGDVPVLITFNYSRCPQLCSVQLDGLVDTLRKLEWTAGGGEFRILTIGLDPE